MKIILCGPPQSGKSVIREGLKEAIKELHHGFYPYVITACPDGEGAWFQQTMNADPELAKACKATYKSAFTPEFVRRVAESVQNCMLPLTLVDIGGKPSMENKTICKGATHAILIAGNDPKTGEDWNSRLAPYREFCRELGLVVIAEIFSDLAGIRDEITGADNDPVFRGSAHRLERGEPVWCRPMIRALADYIIKLVNVSEIKAEEGVSIGMEDTRTYIIIKQDDTTVRVGFGVQAQNDRIVKDAFEILERMRENGEFPGGEIIKINGPASIPVAIVIAHALGHLYGAVAFFDPKLRKYVVSIAHGGRYQVGDLVD